MKDTLAKKKKQTNKDKTELISSIILKWFDISQGALSSQILATSQVKF